MINLSNAFASLVKVPLVGKIETQVLDDVTNKNIGLIPIGTYFEYSYDGVTWEYAENDQATRALNVTGDLFVRNRSFINDTTILTPTDDDYTVASGIYKSFGGILSGGFFYSFLDDVSGSNDAMRIYRYTEGDTGGTPTLISESQNISSLSSYKTIYIDTASNYIYFIRVLNNIGASREDYLIYRYTYTTSGAWTLDSTTTFKFVNDEGSELCVSLNYQGDGNNFLALFCDGHNSTTGNLYEYNFVTGALVSTTPVTLITEITSSIVNMNIAPNSKAMYWDGDNLALIYGDTLYIANGTDFSDPLAVITDAAFTFGTIKTTMNVDYDNNEITVIHGSTTTTNTVTTVSYDTTGALLVTGL